MRELADPLIESSFRDALAAIERGSDLTEMQRRHWACSLRVTAAALDKPLDLVPARWIAVRQAIARLHHVPLGVTAKTLSNHRANVRAALRWFAGEASLPSRSAPLSPAWASLRGRVDHFRTRANLSSLIRYCSARGIRPDEVDERVLDACLAYRAATTALRSDVAARRRIARAWNHCAEGVDGWPTRRLVEPPPKATVAGPAWEEFPAGLRQDIERYLAELTQVRRPQGGKRRPPCSAKTIAVRRAKLVAFVRKAARLGMPIGGITSFRALLAPDRVERVLDAYRADGGGTPGIYTVELAEMLVSIAARTEGLEAAALARLDDLRAELGRYRLRGLTDKNMALVRKVLGSNVWRLVVNLPRQLMEEANALRDRAPMKAAGLAQMAVAIGILTVFPVRLGNLGATQIGENLLRPGGPGTCYWLAFPQYDVKNRIRLETPFDVELTELLDAYIQDHLPTLRRGCREPWLFPGVRGRKGLATLSAQVSRCIRKATGLQVTVHQFRHAAAALILREKPGGYEHVRRILGHRNLQTTVNFYIGLETAQATREFGEIIRSKMRLEVEPL